MGQPPAASLPSVVTGGAGFIGSHLVDALLARGERVHVVDNLSSGRRDRVPEGAQLHEADVADLEALLAIVRDHGPIGRWYHLAAQADVRVSVQDPIGDARTNVLGTIAVLEAARVNGACVVLASTGGAIYGEAPTPTPETAPERPESPYGAAKLAAEAYVATYARLYGQRNAVMRYANVYGPRQDPHGEAGVVAIFGGKVLETTPAGIFGTGAQTRDYVYVDDVIAATVAAADAATDGAGGDVAVFNVGTGIETSVLELWSAMAATAGVSPGYELLPARPGELARSALDATRARSILGVSIDTPLDVGLARTLDWMRARSG